MKKRIRNSTKIMENDLKSVNNRKNMKFKRNNTNLKEKIILANDTLWNTYQYIHNHIVVENDVTLTISNSTDFYAGVKITLTDGAKLIVDNATLNNVTIDAQSGSIIELDNGATIYTNNGFFVPKGVILALINGKIL